MSTLIAIGAAVAVLQVLEQVLVSVSQLLRQWKPLPDSPRLRVKSARHYFLDAPWQRLPLFTALLLPL